MNSHPEATALAIAGSIGLLASTVLTWFSVLVQYPTDESLVRYKVFGPPYQSLHDYTVFGSAFEVLTVLAGIMALLMVLYGNVVVRRARAVATVLIVSGAVALAVVPISWITFEITDPLRAATSGNLRLGAGAILAALSAGAVLAAGLLVRFRD